MTADDNMLYLQMSDRKIQNSKQIHIRIYDEVSYVAMNKDLTWLRPGDLISRYATITTADP